MSSLMTAVYNAGNNITSRLCDLAIDLTGVRPHNIIDPCCSDSVIRKPVCIIIMIMLIYF